MKHYYVISYDADEALPYGVAWFDDILPHNNPFIYFATRDECVAHVANHCIRTNPVLLADDTADAAD